MFFANTRIAVLKKSTNIKEIKNIFVNVFRFHGEKHYIVSFIWYHGNYLKQTKQFNVI